MKVGSHFGYMPPVFRASTLSACCLAGLLLGVLSANLARAGERTGGTPLLPSVAAGSIRQAPLPALAVAESRVTVRVAPLNPNLLTPADFADWDRDDRR